jgi:hypothetical protein
MATDCITQVTFAGQGFGKPVVARFDLRDASFDGGWSCSRRWRANWD